MSKKDDGSHFLFSAKTSTPTNPPTGTSGIGEKTKIPPLEKAMTDLRLDTAELSSLSAARKARGYSKRSFNMYLTKLANLMKDYEAQPTNKNLKYLVSDGFDKLNKAFIKLEKSQEKVIELIPENEMDDEIEFLQEFFDQFTEIQERMSELDIDISISFGGKLDEKVEEEDKPLPSRRFKPGEEEKIPDEAVFLFKALGANYKVTDHVESFTAQDTLRYVGFRHQWESADRALTRQGFSDFEKLLELKKVLKFQPLKLIEHLPNKDPSYQLALTILDDMYLNPQISINQITQKLAELPKQGTTVSTIRDFHTEVLSLYYSMKSLDLEADFMGSSLFISSIQPKLNSVTLREWCKLTIKRKNDSPLGHSCTIQDLLDIIKFNLQMAETFSIQQPSSARPLSLEKTQT